MQKTNSDSLQNSTAHRGRPQSGWRGRHAMNMHCWEGGLASYWTGATVYGAGPGVIIGGVAHGSHGLHGTHGLAKIGADMHGSHGAPRHNQLQQRHPTALLVSINTAVKINSFFIIRISNRNVLVPSDSFRQVNSTPLLMMCKCNLCIF